MSALTDDRALDDFWEASSLDRLRVGAFTARLLAFTDPPPAVHPYTPPGAPVELRPVHDRLQRLFNARRSRRTFSQRPLRHRQVERILAATGPGPGGRVIPEAGGLAAIHVYALVRHARGPLGGQVVRYDHVAHQATPVGKVPADGRLRELFGLDGPTLPQQVLVFVADPAAVVVKYGSRGGRFVLQQVGHAAQNVSLRLAVDRLRGYVLGGGLDHEVLGVLGLAHTGARYAGAMACGR
jgi:hypothetical protein